jgi:hypothetical protein
MTTPSGLLAWGQAGHYDAVDDRIVITALAGGSAGLVVPPTLTAQAGLTVRMGPWVAIVDCGDLTRGVIGTRDQQNIDVPAGGGATRTDIIWADIDPDGGLYSVALYPQSATVGRPGVALGSIVVPAGANTAAAMDLRPGAVTAGRPTPWQSFAPLGNGWWLGAGPPPGYAQYRHHPAADQLEISSLMRTPSAAVNNVTIATFPVPYRPNREQRIHASLTDLNVGTGNGYLVLLPNGQLSARNVGAAGGQAQVHVNAMIPLDVP